MSARHDGERPGENGELVVLEDCRPRRAGAKPASAGDVCDPHGMIRAALAGLGDARTCAEDLFVAWILALPPRLDAAAAARRLLRAYLPGRHRPAGALGQRVARLLAEAACGVPGGSPHRNPARPSQRRRALRGL